MNRTKVKLIIGDCLIGLAFALLPGIRGYSNWRLGEYLMIALIAGYILYLRHKKTRQPESK
jgi:hypothetical protein